MKTSRQCILWTLLIMQTKSYTTTTYIMTTFNLGWALYHEDVSGTFARHERTPPPRSQPRSAQRFCSNCSTKEDFAQIALQRRETGVAKNCAKGKTWSQVCCFLEKEICLTKKLLLVWCENHVNHKRHFCVGGGFFGQLFSFGQIERNKYHNFPIQNLMWGIWKHECHFVLGAIKKSFQMRNI